MGTEVTVSDDCLKKFQELKRDKKLKYIVFDFNKDETEIIVLKSSSSWDYDEFLEDLPETECRWAVYDFEFDKGEGKRNKLLFFSWTPDAAKVKQKMSAASAKHTLRKQLVGIALEIQGTDTSEVSFETVYGKVK
ncbi:actin-binding ADF family protein [Streptomyces noursei]|uniref:actin-binding ADF family protein n=1 Tax=Streptomyces noursei TaxID=1971 RepID=UPI0036308758